MASNEEGLYAGNVFKQLQRIQSDGLIAAPAAYVLLRRLECVLSNETVPGHLRWDVDTGDGIAEHPDGRAKYVFDCFADGAWKNLGRLKDGRFVLHDGMYEQLRGVECSCDTLAGALNREFSSVGDVVRHGVWKAASRHSEKIEASKAFDARLLSEYARRVVFPQFTNAMGMYLNDASEKPRLQASYVSGLEGGSQFGGWCGLGVYGRLVGIAPEALEDARKRSYVVCERASKMDYPTLKGGRRANTERGVGENAGLAETNKKQAPVEVKSASGFMPGKEYDITIDEAGKYVHEEEVIQAVNVVKSGCKYPPALIEDFEKTLERNLRKAHD